MRKISKLLLLTAASSAFISGAALAGGAPATLGGSSSFTGGLFNTPAVPNTVASFLGSLASPQVTQILGPIPNTSSGISQYVQVIMQSRGSTVVTTAVRDFNFEASQRINLTPVN